MNPSIKKRFHKRIMFLILLLSALSSPLFFYYWFDFDVPLLVVALLYAVWVLSFVFDMGITLQNRHLIKQYESNIVFQSLYAKFHAVAAVSIQMSIESSFVLFMPFLFDKNDLAIDVQASSLIAAIIAVLHFTAWHHNKKTIRTLEK